MQRTVLITGATRGLGETMARLFASKGDRLLLVARGQAQLLRLQTELDAAIFPADLADPASAEKILAWARQQTGQLDVLINNAAITGPIGPFWNNCRVAWQETLQVNLLSPAELMRGAIPWMAGHGGGVVINLSGGGATGPRPNFSAYATAKSALVRLTESVAAEARPLNVRLHSIAPGVMKTELLKDVLRAAPEAVGPEFQQVTKIMEGDGADPAIAAALAYYLTTEEAKGLTGRLISALWDPWSNLHEKAPLLDGSDVYTLRRILPKDRGMDWES